MGYLGKVLTGYKRFRGTIYGVWVLRPEKTKNKVEKSSN